MDDSQLRRGKEWLEKLLELSGLSATVDADAAQIQQEGSYWLTIDSAPLTSEQVETLIGADGSVLDAVQYLANTTLNLGQPEGQQCAYTVELNGYRAKRQAELQAMAEQAAAKVRETGEEFEMVALSAAERRQVHTFLKSFEDLETYSRGREPDRRLVVRPLQS